MKRTPGTKKKRTQAKQRDEAVTSPPRTPNVFDMRAMQRTQARDEQGIVVSPIYDFGSQSIWEQPDGTPASMTIPGPTASRARHADLRVSLERRRAEKTDAGEPDEPKELTTDDVIASIDQNIERNAQRYAHSLLAWTVFQEREDGGGFDPVPLTPENALALFSLRPDIVQQLALAEERHKATFRAGREGSRGAGNVERADG